MIANRCLDESVAYAVNNFGGGFKAGSLASYGVRGAEHRRRRRIFENLKKISEEDCKNIFAYFANNFQNHALTYRVFGRLFENCEKIVKFSYENSM